MKYCGIGRNYNYHILFVICFLGATFFCNTKPIFAVDDRNLFPVDISAKNEPISEVLKQIRAQTGYEVEIDSIDKSQRVSGIYRNISTENVLTSILSQYNIAVTVDQNKKVLTATLLGVKDGQKTPESAVNTSDRVTDAGLEVDNEHDLQHDTSVPTIDAMSSQQVSEIDTQHIDPFTNLPFDEIEAMHAEQVKEFENNPEAFDPLLSLGDNLD